MEQENKEKIEMLYQFLGVAAIFWLPFIYPRGMVWALPLIVGVFVIVVRSLVK